MQPLPTSTPEVGLNPNPGWLSNDRDRTFSVAWGDMDGDGDLDLAVGNFREPDKVYLNKDGVLETDPAWHSAENEKTQDVAWGDVDADGDLDLAVASLDVPIKVYLNHNGMLQSTAAWRSADADGAWSIAWGDVDGDGDFDLATSIGKIYFPSSNRFAYGVTKIYLNQGHVLEPSPNWISTDGGGSVAWGDMDSDGDLDLAVGAILLHDYPDTSRYFGEQSKVYVNHGLNQSGKLQLSPGWTARDSDSTSEVAWGDINRDGRLDLVVGNAARYDSNCSCPSNSQDKLYLNLGATLSTVPSWTSTVSANTRSVALGDVDGDGDLDLAAASDNFDEPDRVYLNNQSMLETTPAWITGDLENSTSVAWGDIDRDGDLDLAVGEWGVPNKIYYNEANTLALTAGWRSGAEDDVWRVAWGDADGDGDLDLAIGDWRFYDFTCNCYLGGETSVFLNIGGVLQTTPTWMTTEGGGGVAWGDVDGDSDLDLAIGNPTAPNRVYANRGLDAQGRLQFAPLWTAAETHWTRSVAWGDVDADGDLDLAIGNVGSPDSDHDTDLGEQNQLYLNDHGVLRATASWTSAESDPTYSLVWGDVDGDGDLDLAAGNSLSPSRVYLNFNGVLQTNAAWASADRDRTTSVAWGDVDGDGDLDLAVGNMLDPNKLYLNQAGRLQTTAIQISPERDNTTSIAWGDVDSDGDLDLAVGNRGYYVNSCNCTVDGENKVYLNQGGMLQPGMGWRLQMKGNNYQSVAWGDVDGDGDLDLAASNEIYLNPQPAEPLYRGSSMAIAIDLRSEPVSTLPGRSSNLLAPADFYAIPGTRQSGIIPITYKLFHPAGEPMRTVRALYSLDGGAHWLPATATADTVTTDLSTSPYPTLGAHNTHIFKWDVFSSGFFGQSDQVVFRIEALPNLKPVKNSVPGPFQRPFVATQTYPFRVRGTQVRVINENYQPSPNTLVYRLAMTQTLGGLPVGQNNLYFRTSAAGYLPGRGELYPGDRLLALAPIQSTQRYTLYHTSATPTETGLNAHNVTQAGIQTLTVSAANPLVLLNLDVSLEWDTSNDPVFLAQLRENLLKTSYALYDWTNGQVALGQMNIYQAKERWDTADIRIYASNQMRPVAHRGGIVEDIVVLPLPGATQAITATRGEIRIGPTWNRYGDQGAIGDDWPNVLAHELGHFALFLEDTYLGLDENKKLLVPIETCTGTAMTDPYDSISSEFRYNDGRWQQDCGRSLAELPEWELIRLAYPALHAPPPENRGPAAMPFAFTQIEIRPAPPGITPLLVDTNLALNGAGDELAGGRAYLIQPGQHLVDLGRPLLSSIQARGARDGDELCLFADQHFACNRLSNNMPAQFESQLQPLWRPEILLTPINTTTLRIQVNNPGDANSLTATIYPNGDAPQIVNLAPGVPQIVTLQQPAVEAWVDLLGSSPTQRMITGYTTGSGPGRARSHGGPGRARSHGGSFTSGDGRVTLYPPATLPEDVSMVLQTATALPDPLPGLRPIGRAYQIYASSAYTNFAGASLSFQYMNMEIVLSGQPEKNLTVYYWDGRWHRLHTERDLEQDFASAPLPGPGLYVLMSGVEFPLYGPGWNLVSYPIQETRPITQALASIDGYYTTVYGYEPTDVSDPWKVYDVDVPSWVNDLHEMRFGQGYWISVTQTITWFIADVPVTPSGLQGLLPMPPATYYGLVPSSVGFVPAAGMVVTARVNGKVCGQGQTREVVGQVVYVIDVLADGSGDAAGCGRPEQVVTLDVGLQKLATIPWRNSRPQALLWPGQQRVYMPLIIK